jgi:hypothetical protein
MYLVEIGCAILIALIALWVCELEKKYGTSYEWGFSMVLASSPLLFQSIIEKLFDENLPITHNVINIFSNVSLYFVLFSIILLIKKIEFLTVIIIVLIQIMYLTFRILSVIVRRFNTIRKIIFHLFFFSLLVVSFIYGFKNEWGFLELFIKSLPIPILLNTILIWLYLYSDKKDKISK